MPEAKRKTILFDERVYNACKAAGKAKGLKVYESFNYFLAKQLGVDINVKELKDESLVERSKRPCLQK